MNNTNEPTGQQLTPGAVATELKLFYKNFRPLESDPTYPARLINAYAAQQTAGLSKQLTIAISLLQDFPIAERGDFSIGGKHHEWYCNRCDFLEHNGVLGTGVIKQTNEKDALREEREQYKTALSDMTGEAKANFDFAQQYQQELEAVKMERNEAVKLLNKCLQYPLAPLQNLQIEILNFQREVLTNKPESHV